jgi:hypothetical protein
LVKFLAIENLRTHLAIYLASPKKTGWKCEVTGMPGEEREKEREREWGIKRPKNQPP